MSGMPALDKGPKANCHGTALLASSAGIRQTPPQRSSVASTRNLAQHQRAVRHWRSCKILQVPTHPASNKILRIATDVVIIRSRRLLMGGCRARRSSCVYGVRGRSRGRGSELVRTELCRTPKGTYRPPEMDRSGPLLTATGPRERVSEHCTTFRHLGCYCVFRSPFLPGLRALSCSINFHQHHILEHV